MNDSPKMVSRDFKGIWIPREIWLNEDLLPIEKLIWAQINSLFDHEKGGCDTRNEDLYRFFGVGKTYISKVISKLKSLGLIEEVFNGRQIIIRVILPETEQKVVGGKI